MLTKAFHTFSEDLRPVANIGIWAKIVIFILLFGLPAAFAQPMHTIPASFEELMERVRENYRFTQPDYEQLQAEAGQVLYVPVSSLKSGQHQISFLTVQDKIKNFIKTYPEGDRLPFDEGRSLYPPETSGQAILLKHSILLIDGNHKAMNSLWWGAETVPVEVLHDWRDRTLTEAYNDLLQQHLIWPYDVDGSQSRRIRLMTELEDNPLRNWVASVLGKVKLSEEKSGIEIKSKKEVENPIAVKVGRDIPYHEWVLVLALTFTGFTEYLEEDRSLTPETIEFARTRLKQALKDEDFPERERLSRILFIEDAEVYRNDKKLLKLIRKYLKGRDCKSKLPVSA